MTIKNKFITIAIILFICNSAQAQFGATFELSEINGENGLIINGENENNWLGYFIAQIGDVNNDGIHDILVNAPGSDLDKTYVIYGNSQGYDSPFDLSTLNGSNGFVIINSGSLNQISKAGDINGDGIDDVFIGGISSSYVIFGRDTVFPSEFDTTDIDGSNGFIINGYALEDEINVGSAVSGGDLNSDGLNDIVITTIGHLSRNGIVYVLFGSDQPYSAINDISNLDGSNGFIVIGQNDYDSIGSSVSIIGDVNNDGVDDLGLATEVQNNATDGYVIFGSNQPFLSQFDLSTLNGNNGFKIPSIDGNFQGSSDFGASINGAGDINHDGIDDIILGYGSSDFYKGAVYVVYGKAQGFNANFDLTSLNGNNGFSIKAQKRFFRVGTLVNSIGDVNADGIDDILFIAAFVGGSVVETYVVNIVIYGSVNLFPANFDLSSINGNNGFAIKSYSQYVRSLVNSLASSGDFNNDGIGDILIGASQEGDKFSGAGAAYIIYGRGDLIFNGGFEN